jgi:hypothetical protein
MKQKTIPLSKQNPKLAEEWHPEKNGNLTPDDVIPLWAKKVWWKCKKGHEWQAVIVSRKNGTGCPHCYRLLRKEGFYSESRTAPLQRRCGGGNIFLLKRFYSASSTSGKYNF